MDIYQNLMSHIIPSTRVRASTKWNRDIRVVYSNGAYRLLVDGIEQSSPRFYQMWRQVFRTCRMQDHRVSRALILGLGGCNIIHLLKNTFPAVRIDVVDIDEKIVELANEYFGLSELTDVKVTVADADVFVRDLSQKHIRSYDFVAVDVYSGSNMPPFVDHPEFYERIAACMTDTGILQVNYSPDWNLDESSDAVRAVLSDIFPTVRIVEIQRNRFLCCRKSEEEQSSSFAP